MKRCFAALALVCALALSGVAKAEGTGMYLAPKFLMSIQNNYPTLEVGPDSASENYSQFTLGGALALGYDFYSQFGVPVRAEVEYALRGNSEKSWSYDALDVKGAWNASTLFLNLYYDFRNSTAFTPYWAPVWAWPSITPTIRLPPRATTPTSMSIAPPSPGTWAPAWPMTSLTASPWTWATVM